MRKNDLTLFVSIPNFSAYEINSKGEVRNKATGNFIKPKTDNQLQVQIKNDNGVSRRVNWMNMAADLFAAPLSVPTESRVMASKKLTMHQKVYYLKTESKLTHEQIGLMFGKTKDAVSGIYDRLRTSPQKVAEYNNAIQNL